MSEIPEDPTDLATWLERILVDVHLGKLVATLDARSDPGGDGDRSRSFDDRSGPPGHDVLAHRRSKPARDDLSEILGDHYESILESGLRLLTSEQLMRIFERPRLLLELQSRVLFEGGSYWKSLGPPSAELRSLIEQAHARLENRSKGGSGPPQHGLP
jgi:hypothetical protein